MKQPSIRSSRRGLSEGSPSYVLRLKEENIYCFASILVDVPLRKKVQ
ncbi:hypothetical protein GRAN_4813 [Granulicella sibirica]|uniref:Uncharacterized protein n=1 Tax=Granulicella sibirica TaxID=2479048 RepID=A0A4Q0SV03_9BACT|nr:hypothetical protein GRAN_4813 [Granulicella sibirica]